MATWRDEAIQIIGEVHNALPAGADIKTRKRALREACPHEYRSTSWGRKVWGKAATAYLTKMGMPSTVSRPLLPLSPLERLMQKGAK
jgi:hypothetical protein